MPCQEKRQQAGLIARRGILPTNHHFRVNQQCPACCMLTDVDISAGEPTRLQLMTILSCKKIIGTQS